ncbi:MAG: hypothetical protein PHU12_03140, partial [Candidatus Aenigmarchaeota archaeon]|nr:hypothetical protein [Candidatus Aenigmarchaeota archaeon]
SPIKNKAANLIIALAISAFSASYTPFMSVLWSYLPSVTWFFIVMFFLVFAMQVFGIKPGEVGDEKKGPERLFVNGIVLFVLLSIAWMLGDLVPIREFPVIGSFENLIFIIGLLFIIMIIWTALKIGAGDAPKRGGAK